MTYHTIPLIENSNQFFSLICQYCATRRFCEGTTAQPGDFARPRKIADFARALPRNQAILRGRAKLPGSCANVTRFQWFFFAHNFSYITFFVLNLQTWNLRCTHLISKPKFTPKHIDLSLLLLLQYSVKRKFARNARNRPGRRYLFSNFEYSKMCKLASRKLECHQNWIQGRGLILLKSIQ